MEHGKIVFYRNSILPYITCLASNDQGGTFTCQHRALPQDVQLSLAMPCLASIDREAAPGVGRKGKKAHGVVFFYVVAVVLIMD